MKVLVIGGCHVGNYGLQSGEGFLQQWINHLSTVYRETVQITCFALVSYHQLPMLLNQNYSTFEEADLILFQMGNYELSYRGAFWDLFFKTRSHKVAQKLPSSSPIMPISVAQFSNVEVYNYPRHWFDWLKNVAKVITLRFYRKLGGRIPLLDQLSQSMGHDNELLRPFASKIVMLTPFPSLNAVDHWLRRASKPLFLLEAKRNGFILLDIKRAVPLRRSYFLPDTYHLNQRGHDKMAHFLIKSLVVVPTTNPRYSEIKLDSATALIREMAG